VSLPEGTLPKPTFRLGWQLEAKAKAQGQLPPATFSAAHGYCAGAEIIVTKLAKIGVARPK